MTNSKRYPRLSSVPRQKETICTSASIVKDNEIHPKVTLMLWLRDYENPLEICIAINMAVVGQGSARTPVPRDKSAPTGYSPDWNMSCSNFMRGKVFMIKINKDVLQIITEKNHCFVTSVHFYSGVKFFCSLLWNNKIYRNNALCRIHFQPTSSHIYLNKVCFSYFFTNFRCLIALMSVLYVALEK